MRRLIRDQPIANAWITVRTGNGPSSGTGTGKKLDRTLAPGETARLEWRSGKGRGSLGGDEPVTIAALVEMLEASGCPYRPSQSWPTKPADMESAAR